MEAIPWTEIQYKQASLPKLKTAEESSMPRRDSITSSRTGDSGYHSEPDVSLSPLDLVNQGMHLSLVTSEALLHGLPAFSFDPPVLDVNETGTLRSNKSSRGSHCPILLGVRREGRKRLPPLGPAITSNPSALAPIQKEPKEGWPQALIDSIQEATRPQDAGSWRTENIDKWVKENLPTRDRPKERVSSIVSLSSTGSCDMYTSTDISDDEEVSSRRRSILSKAALKTIELIMRKVEVNLRYMACVQCAGTNAAKGQGNTANMSRGGGRGSVQSSGGKRKARESCPPDETEDDGSSKRRRVSITTTEDSDAGPRFACPFYKHDPNRYRNRRTCPGPGWPTVHRMKEHLYRSHAQPIFCPRCYAIFETDNEFSAHLRSRPCEISAPQPIEGIDRETLKSLHKRSPALRLEEDKWRDAYQMLFPDVSTADIPSPYYDSASPTEESRRFRRALLSRIRQELFSTAEQESAPVEQNLLRQVAGIIQRCEDELLASFYGDSQPSQPVLAPGVTTSRPSSNATPRHRISQSPAPPTPMSAPPAAATLYPMRMGANVAATTGLAAGSGVPQYVSEPPMQYPYVWDDLFQTSSNEFIDWNAVFPPGVEHAPPQPQAPSDELPPTLVTPVWT